MIHRPGEGQGPQETRYDFTDAGKKFLLTRFAGDTN